MRSMTASRWLWLPGLVVGLLALLAGEAVFSFRGGGSPEAPGSPDEVVSAKGGRTLTLAVLGDSTGSGVGAVTQDQGYPRRVARGLADRLGATVDLRVYAVSGARVHDVLVEQLPRMEGLRPNLVLLVVGGNDAVHLTRPVAARADLGATLDRLGSLGVPVVVSGLPAMGTVARAPQPLRSLLGLSSGRLYDPIWREETRRRGMIRVDLAAITGPLFARDRSLLAPDLFHPGPRGYEAWAAAFLPALEKAVRLPLKETSTPT